MLDFSQHLNERSALLYVLFFRNISDFANIADSK